MGTKISWADKTWNPITGCTQISPGCANCYAKRMANRLRGRYGYPADEPFRPTFHPGRLDQPGRWKKPCRVFVCSMGDLFHEDVSRLPETSGPCALYRVFSAMIKAPHHTYMILTKRPDRMVRYVKARDYFDNFRKTIPNLWFGVTVESNAERWRIDYLLKLREYAKVLFVSAEPLLGELDLDEYIPQKSSGGIHIFPNEKRLDWIIVGAETGPNARRMNSSWALSIMDRCESNQLPFFFKRDSDGSRLLDGVKHEEWPE